MAAEPEAGHAEPQGSLASLPDVLCPSCGQPMERGFVPPRATLRWGVWTGDVWPVFYHALPGSGRGWFGLNRLSACRCHRCELIVLRYGKHRHDYRPAANAWPSPRQISLGRMLASFVIFALAFGVPATLFRINAALQGNGRAGLEEPAIWIVAGLLMWHLMGLGIGVVLYGARGAARGARVAFSVMFYLAVIGWMLGFLVLLFR